MVQLPRAAARAGRALAAAAGWLCMMIHLQHISSFTLHAGAMTHDYQDGQALKSSIPEDKMMVVKQRSIEDTSESCKGAGQRSLDRRERQVDLVRASDAGGWFPQAGRLRVHCHGEGVAGGGLGGQRLQAGGPQHAAAARLPGAAQICLPPLQAGRLCPAATILRTPPIFSIS